MFGVNDFLTVEVRSELKVAGSTDFLCKNVHNSRVRFRIEILRSGNHLLLALYRMFTCQL